ncbi:histidine decarboxylase [Kitasatospora sp. GP82]|uniref:histidine decarboxylase n=1 Tax=Kitasatospora sp. GP82 TaxID=3035089 RepID=UPI0024751AB0|nr:histidine decarboxylase [Kitasatospora sp. GP82]MDH6128682.1 histidine decarboxylase [Kitasatospora sp. GP82]
MTDVTSRPHQLPQVPFGSDGETWQQILESQGLSNGHAAPVSGPIGDPQAMYPVEPGLETRAFELPASGLSDAKRRKALSSMELYLADRRDHMLGYQVTQDMNGYPTDLSRFMENHLNNIGDPFQSGGYKPNTKIAERAVLDYYAALWNAQWPHDPRVPESYWGYMLSMGSTEGNMYALWNARDYLSGKALIESTEPTTFGALRYVQAAPHIDNPNAFHPVAFFSEDTHYSFAKAVRVLNVDTFHAAGEALYPGRCPLTDADGRPLKEWPTEVPSRRGPSGNSADGPGEIDIDALETLVKFFAGNGHPIMISLNYGSTFKGAHDDVRRVCERLLPIFEENGLLERPVQYGKDPKTGEAKIDLRRGFWIHVDGALGAGYGPFMRMAYEDPRFGWTPEVDLPEFDFGLTLSSEDDNQIDMVASIAMSGHKWPGAPWPCGIYMTKVKYQLMPPSQPQYIGSPDTTFAGSRNGFSPLVIWDHLARHSYQDQVNLIRHAQDLSIYLENRLRQLERKHRVKLWPARTRGALTVRFRRPSDKLVDKWSLSTEDVFMVPKKPETRRRYAHIFLMASTTREKIDAFLAELERECADQLLPAVEALPTLAAEAPVELADGVLSLAAVPGPGRGFQ